MSADRNNRHARINNAICMTIVQASGSLLVGIIGLHFLLQHHQLLIPLIEAGCERNHDVSLLQQQLLEPVGLQAVLRRCLPFCLQLTQPLLILSSYPLVLPR